MIIKENYKLAEQSSMRVGGPARYFVELTSPEEFTELQQFLAQKQEQSLLILGACTNIVIADSGFDGVVVKNQIDLVEWAGDVLRVGAGVMLPQLALLAIDEGRAGLEKVGTVPGTVGGAIWGNAEAGKQSISDYLVEVEWGDLQTGRRILTKDECAFGYRQSVFKSSLNGQGIILAARFRLPAGEREQLRRAWEEGMTGRRESQPTEASCGCFFENIVLDEENWAKLEQALGEKALVGRKRGGLFSTGQLLDRLGLKGECRGEACISQVHANFLVNRGAATAQQVYDLSEFVKKEVAARTGIKLENEVVMVGEFNK
jgi:UDP-N-acetylmuramate dehydrogenase